MSATEDLVKVVPGLARLAVGTWWRTAGWSLQFSVATSERILRAAISGRSPAELLAEFGSEARMYAQELLGLLEEAQAQAEEEADRSSANGRAPDGTLETLRRMGEDLLARSADMRDDEDAHPAYMRILGELAPDEARILRLLALGGPQPAVDVRTSRPLNIATELVAPGLNMIGTQAGCRHVKRVPAYLNNLERLGLIWFSREPLPDPLSYQVLEAQPEVVEALRASGRGKTVRRSIHLTPFGRDFCETCLPLTTAEMEALAPS